jgi:hypothetical protein
MIVINLQNRSLNLNNMLHSLKILSLIYSRSLLHPTYNLMIHHMYNILLYLIIYLR